MSEPEPVEGVRWIRVPSSGAWVGIPTDPDEDVYGATFAARLPDATPPLVAAPPVPPVVPDSEALDLPMPACGHESCRLNGDGIVWEFEDDDEPPLPSGSGVVPDKPALAEAVRDVLWRAQRFGETDDGDTAHYIVTKGAMHRLMGAAQAAGIPASFRNDDSIEVPDKPALAPRCTCTTKYVSDITGLFLHETVCPLSVPAVTDDEAATKVRAVALALAAVDGYDTYARQANEFITRLRSAGFLIVHHTKET